MAQTEKSVKERLEKASRDIHSLYITNPMVVRFFSIYGGSREKAVRVFDAMMKTYEEYLAKKSLINPGAKGVPNRIALDYLRQYGITPEKIEEDRHNRRIEG